MTRRSQMMEARRWAEEAKLGPEEVPQHTRRLQGDLSGRLASASSRDDAGRQPVQDGPRPVAGRSGKLVRLKMTAGANAVVFGVKSGVPWARAAWRDGARDPLGAGTMSSSGVTCPGCGVTATMADLRAAGRARRLDERMTAKGD